MFVRSNIFPLILNECISYIFNVCTYKTNLYTLNLLETPFYSEKNT